MGLELGGGIQDHLDPNVLDLLDKELGVLDQYVDVVTELCGQRIAKKLIKCLRAFGNQRSDHQTHHVSTDLAGLVLATQSRSYPLLVDWHSAESPTLPGHCQWL